jgi:UDP-N-acetylmuramyl pentapeptide phosphotransferase/UDP-N-acetylglucosamine-1-phosphate transferase
MFKLVLVFLSYFISLVVCVVASWALLQGLVPQLRRRLIDQPNARSSHTIPTPRGGGVSFVLVVVVFSSFSFLQLGWSALTALPLMVLPLALVGLLDDLYQLPSGWRFSVQLATAVVLLGVSPLVQSLPLTLSALPLVLICVLLLIGSAAVINFTNFMDGLDGLVAGCMSVVFAASAFSGMPEVWPLVGALLGFLAWNWSPAKVFMGDVGSTFLGAMLVGVVSQQATWTQALGLLLVATPLLADSCICVLRRLRAGQRVFQAHSLHLYQRLYQSGWPHYRVAILYIASTSLLAISYLIGGWSWVVFFSSLIILLGVWFDQRVAVPFSVSLARRAKGAGLSSNI